MKTFISLLLGQCYTLSTTCTMDGNQLKLASFITLGHSEALWAEWCSSSQQCRRSKRLTASMMLKCAGFPVFVYCGWWLLTPYVWSYMKDRYDPFENMPNVPMCENVRINYGNRLLQWPKTGLTAETVAVEWPALICICNTISMHKAQEASLWRRWKDC